MRTIAALQPGSDVRLGIVRDGRELVVGARLAERGPEESVQDEEAERRSTPVPVRRGDALGLAVANLPARVRADLHVPRDRQGVVIQAVLGADPGTDVLEEGDIVVEVNRQPTPDLASYRRVDVGPAAGPVGLALRVSSRRPRGSFLTRVEVEQRP